MTAFSSQLSMQLEAWFGSGEVALAFLGGFVVWSLVWKGWSLWLAARRGEKLWFLALLLINSLGILEIIYIFLVAKQKDTTATVAHDPTPTHEQASDRR